MTDDPIQIIQSAVDELEGIIAFHKAMGMPSQQMEAIHAKLKQTVAAIEEHLATTK